MVKPDILVIDDDPVIQMQLKEYLEGTSLICEFYTCPEEGFDKLKVNGARVCILDYMMPRLTGEEIAIKFSEELLFEKGSIYLYTSKEFSDNERFKMLTLGFSEILKKPMTKEKLFQILADNGIAVDSEIAA